MTLGNIIFWVFSMMKMCLKKRKMSERSITERTKLRKERVDEIKRKEQNINNELFREYFTNYHSPSVMYGKLRETKGAVNELRVNLIKDVLT